MKTIKKPFTVLAGKCLALPLLAALFIPTLSFARIAQADDTQTLQALLNTGGTLPAGKTYNVSASLLVNKSINLNGDIINWNGTAGGCMKIQTAGVVVQNGTINGTWAPTGTYNPAGASGIVIYADNVTVTKMTVQNVPNYGIVVSGARNTPTITYNTIKNTGYIGFYYDAEGATTGGNFSFNTIDRSAIPASSVHQLAIGIRGNSNSTTPVSTGWVITNNTVTMPLNPTDWTAECIEVRALVNANISNNTFNNSSIGVSLYRSTGTTVANNKFYNAQLEAIEVNDCATTACNYNVITGGNTNGYLFDGTNGSNGTTITGDVISGTKGDCIHATAGTQNIKIINAKLTATNGTNPISLLGTTGVSISGGTMTGDNSPNQNAVLLTNCVGGLTVNGATVQNFAKALVYISSTNGAQTKNVTVSGNVVSNVKTALGTYLINGSTVDNGTVVVTLK